MDEDDAEEWETPSYPWSWKSAGVYVGYFAYNVLGAASIMAKGLAEQLAASCNHDIQKRKFREAAALEIESLTNPEE